jgi:hypothetical protein
MEHRSSVERIWMGFWNAVPRDKRTAIGSAVSACLCDVRSNELVVACHQCGGKQDLNDETCLNGVIESLAQQGGVTGILLSGDWDVVYGPVCTAILRSIADVKSFCKQMGTPKPGSRDCIHCSSNPSSVFSAISASLLENWRDGCQKQMILPASANPHCCRCHRETRRGVEQIVQLMTEVEQHIDKRGHKAIEVKTDG